MNRPGLKNLNQIRNGDQNHAGHDGDGQWPAPFPVLDAN
jgi:hypothetical protein